MAFDGTSTKTLLNQGMNSMLMLHSSCQGIIEANIAQSPSSWYPILLKELGDAENIVVQWRTNGYLYFQQNILQETIDCGQSFIYAKSNIDQLFCDLENEFSQSTLTKIVNALNQLSSPIASLVSQIDGYETKLKAFEVAIGGVHDKMGATIAQIQKEEQDIQSDIQKINGLITLLKAQILKDRQTIAKAKEAEHRGIWETIFGVLLAPFTGGLSLILAGIGVASIAQAETEVKGLESTIKGYGKQINSANSHLSDDKKQITVLNGLLLSVGLAVKDTGQISTSLDSLRVNWNVLGGNLSNTLTKVQNAQTAKDAMVGKIWFDAACVQWQEIIPHSQNLDNRSVTTTHVSA